MNNWHAFPDRSWSAIGQSLSGFGRGVGNYGLSYVLDVGREPFLNGRVSARIRLGDTRRVAAAGVVCRADELRSFVALYVTKDVNAPDAFSVRLAALKFGTIVAMATLRKPVTAPGGEVLLSLQFFSGEMVGELVTDESSAGIRHLMPEAPFAGRAGLVRFYGAPVFAREIQIEEISSRPVLPEEEDRKSDRGYRYDVFISHSTADKDLVGRIVERFKQASVSYWIDEEQVKFGDPVVGRIEEGLQQSRYVIVALSESLKRSGWVRAEYGPILYREFSGDTSRRVIPLSLDGPLRPDAIPLLLSDKLRADFTDTASFDALIRFLKQPPAAIL
jgi:hypothetical protein